MSENRVMLVTGSRKGIGRGLVEHYSSCGWQVIGCSRKPSEWSAADYEHYCLDVSDEQAVKELMAELQKKHKRLDVLLNNAGIAAMNHALLTPMSTARRVLETNVLGTFLFCREAAKVMQRSRFGRIVNFSSIAVPFDLSGEAVYAASKAAVESLTRVLAAELAELGITVNAIGPTPIKTDLIQAVPAEKLERLLARQPIHRYGEIEDVINVIDFFIRPESNYITSQVIYLGGVS